MKPYPFQEVGEAFLAERSRAYLADRMGLGKTVQTVLAARRVKPTFTLVVAPASTLANWEREWEKWNGPSGMRAISYSKLVRFPKRALLREIAAARPNLLVLDEAHYTKSPSAQRTRMALGLAAKADRAWLLSGSPTPNGDPRELYTAFRYLWPDLMPAGENGLMTSWDWMNYFCKWRPTTYGPKVYGVKNAAVLRGMLARVMLRRDLGDVGIDLPPLRVTVHYLTDEEGAKKYRELDEETPGPTLRRLLGEIKAAPVGELLSHEMKDRAYDKIVVMYYHKATGRVLRDRFHAADLNVYGFDGYTPQKMRQEQIDAFERRDRAVFLVQQQAGGVGINLQTATEIALVEPDWSPEVNAQAIKRVHRIGQTRPVRARVFALSSTLDGPILEAIAEKVERRQEILGNG